MDVELQELIRTYEHLYKNLQKFKNDKNIHLMLIPDIDEAITRYYQNKFEEELKKENEKEIETKTDEEIRKEIDDKAKFQLSQNDDWLCGIKHMNNKLKKKRAQRLREIKEEQKKKYINI